MQTCFFVIQWAAEKRVKLEHLLDLDDKLTPRLRLSYSEYAASTDVHTTPSFTLPEN